MVRISSTAMPVIFSHRVKKIGAIMDYLAIYTIFQAKIV
ncbi:hypothetical protein SPWS13_0697 [Shewanella putrefaciens]|nr:hypothetical protein SPWS13_0697 [Shewanella putrefaciens]